LERGQLAQELPGLGLQVPQALQRFQQLLALGQLVGYLRLLFH
jgi:hypothetical protein